MAVSLTVVAAGLSLAWLLYHKKSELPQQVARALALPTSFVEQRYYFDQFYGWLIQAQQRFIARPCEWFEQRVIIEGLVGNVAAFTRQIGFTVRRLQTGRVQAYVLVFLIGVVWLLTAALR